MSGLALADAVLALAQPWPLKFAIDNALGGQRFPSWLARLDGLGTTGRTAFAIVASLAIVALSGTLSLHLSVRATRTSEEIGAELREALVRRLLALDPAFFQRHRTGDLTSRVTGDVARVEGALVSVSTTAAPELLTLVGIVLIMASLDPVLAGAAVLVVPALWFVTVRRRSAARAVEQASREAAGRLAAESTELIRRVELVQAFGREDFALRRYGHRNRRVLEAEVRAAVVEGRYRPVADLLVAAVGGLCLAIGVARVSAGRMTVGVLLVLLAYMSRIFGPVRALSSLATSMARAAASRDRLREVLSAHPAVPVGGGGLEVPDAPFVLSLEHVSFAYRADEPVLRDVSLTIPARGLVAIVGRSGAGKSTLLHLLRRVYDPTEGRITLHGTPLDSYSVESLRARMAYVAQDASLLEGTIAENIAFAREGAALHEVRAAARLAGADRFVSTLAHGYRTELTEGGVGLSGGQRRRIALARAVLRDAPVLLLDEPTSGLDATSETEVQEVLLDIARGRTLVVVTHQLALAACADLVIVLDGGTVAEIGAPDALLASDGPFSRLWAVSHGLDSKHQTERQGTNDEQSQGVLGPVRRRQRLGQVREVGQVPQVPQVPQVAQVRQVGLPLRDGTRGSRVLAAPPSPCRHEDAGDVAS